MIKKIKGIYYNHQQNKINKEYEKNGLTDSVLDAQLALNKKRNANDICDKKEIINKDGYVQ